MITVDEVWPSFTGQMNGRGRARAGDLVVFRVAVTPRWVTDLTQPPEPSEMRDEFVAALAERTARVRAKVVAVELRPGELHLVHPYVRLESQLGTIWDEVVR